MMLRVLLLTLLIFLGTFSTTTAVAANTQANKKVTSSKQAAIVQKQYGGKVLKVNKQKNKTGYRVKIVKPNGQVVSKKVNAKTGKIEKH
jgi:uncharacterized membrane protein YkoI